MMNLYRDDNNTPKDKTWNYVTAIIIIIGIVMIGLMVIDKL